MLSEFAPAVEFVLKNEKGYADSPSDSGGATNHGISLRFLRTLSSEKLRRYGIFEPLTNETIRDLTAEQAKMIYRDEFWQAAPFEQIENQKLCNYVFDMAVNHGIVQAVKLLQRATWGVTRMYGIIADDGIMGIATVNQVMRLCSDRYFLEALYSVICSERASFYRLLAEIRPKDRENLNGWLDRAYRI